MFRYVKKIRKKFFGIFIYMSTIIKSGTTTISGATVKGSFSYFLNDTTHDLGPTSTTGLYAGLDAPAGGYVIYQAGGPSGMNARVATSDAQAVTIYKGIGATGTTITDVLAWAAGQSGHYVQTGATPIVSSGLVLNLDASNATSYPGTGTTWNDLSGNANNATLVNGPTFSSTAGGEFSLDGSNDYINLNYTGSDTGSYTYGCWVKLNELPPLVANSTTFMERGRDYFGNGWSVGLSVTNATSPYHFNTTLILTTQGIAGYTATGTSNLSINTWYYVVGSWNASTGALKIYINGQLEGTTTTTNTTLRSSTTGWNLGSISNIYYMDCHIGGAQVYSSVLADSDVLQNYNATKTRYGL